MKFIDISRPLQLAPKYPTAPDSTFAQVNRIEHGDESNFSMLFTNTHAGTHVDAGKHFVHGELSIGQMPLETYYGSCRVVTVPENAMITRQDLLGKLDGAQRLALRHGGYSYLTADATRYILECGIRCVVTEGWSPAPLDNEKEIHQLLLGNHVGIVENVNLQHVADGDYTLIAFPVNFGESDGAPCRAVLMTE